VLHKTKKAPRQRRKKAPKKPAKQSKKEKKKDSKKSLKGFKMSIIKKRNGFLYKSSILNFKKSISD